MTKKFLDMTGAEQRKVLFKKLFPDKDPNDELNSVEKGKLNLEKKKRLSKDKNSGKNKVESNKKKNKAPPAIDKGGRKGADGSKGFTPIKTNTGPNMGIVNKPDSKNFKKSTTSFGKAFADARGAGKKTFMWNGKSYNTKRADDKPKPKPVKTQVDKDTKLKPMTGIESKSVKDLPPLTDKETKRARNNALTEKIKKDLIDRAKNTTGINRPATAKEQMGRDQQKNARKSMGMKKGGMVKKCRMDGIALRGKTRAKERSK